MAYLPELIYNGVDEYLMRGQRTKVHEKVANQRTELDPRPAYDVQPPLPIPSCALYVPLT